MQRVFGNSLVQVVLGSTFLGKNSPHPQYSTGIDEVARSSNKMPAAVREALSFAVEMHGGCTAAEARIYVDRMIREGRLVEECWS